MSCRRALSMTFAVFEIYPDGREYDTGKTLSISSAESAEIMNRRGYDRTDKDPIDSYAIIISLFTKLYTFSIGTNGFALTWEENQEFQNGRLGWAGPREPAIRCGGDWWRIKRIV